MKSPIWPPGTVAWTICSFGVPTYLGALNLLRRRDVVGGSGSR